ncbi:868_t:CDS:2, partial [Scutellospora calospora]
FSAGFVGSGVIFMKVFSAGAFGLIAANAFNLSTRITWSWNFIKNYFLKNRNYSQNELKELRRMLSLSNLLPRSLVLISFFLSWVITFWSNEYIGWATMDAKLKHAGVGCFCAIIVASITYQQERIFIQDVTSLIRGDSQSKKLD